MAATATMTKWGNGVGLLIPKSMRVEAGIGLGDRVRMEARDGVITIYSEDAGWNLHDLMEGYDGPAPEFIDPGMPVGREIW